MTDDIKNFTEDPGGYREIRRGVMRTVPAGDQLHDEPATVGVAPDSMAGQDADTMFLGGEAEPDLADVTAADPVESGSDQEVEKPSAIADMPALEGLEDLEEYVLPYSDGSTTPPLKSPRRDRFRRRQRTVPARDEVERPGAGTTADVWAAHRSDLFEDDTDLASDRPTQILTPIETPDRSRRHHQLVAVVGTGLVVAVVLAGASVIAFGGGGGRTRGFHAGSAGAGQAHGKTHSSPSHVAAATGSRTATSTTSTKPAASHKPKHQSNPMTHTRPATRKTATTSTVTSTPVISNPSADTNTSPETTTPAVASTPKVTSAPEVTSTPKSSAAPKARTTPKVATTPKVTSTPTHAPTAAGTPKSSASTSTSSDAASHSNSDASGGLPDLQQTQQQP